ncbi:Mu-like prophage major head subunit gpT family protein [Neorhizobium sp. T7_12]|uniref:Mu-like prophage major head subunit gpT family protein n=1 Tax=Neorhizobium sp. T7_12 TaxID=2093832 RepID=UPI00197ED383|nr:Mu-like prophage major head subunit gpT family protein [Neorhizobium sp. T7_12]
MAGAGRVLVRPFIFQERRPPNLVRKDGEQDDNVFLRKEYIYGVDSRGAAGFGLRQLAWGSKQTLDAAHYEAARVAMQSLTGEEGRSLGVKPNLLVVPPSLEGQARALLTSPTLANGETNKWFGTAEVLVTP